MFVTFDLWHVPRRRAARAAARMALDRPLLRRTSGLAFSRLLGTGTGQRFTPLDADPSRWALLAVWDTPAAARDFERSATVRAWAHLADERWQVDLRPLASRGFWAGRTPFAAPSPGPSGPSGPSGPPGAAAPPETEEHSETPVVAVTRARLTARRAVAFWRAVPPVATELRGADGLLFAAGIGEAPVGFQGTFSVWRDAAALRAFAYQGQAHTAVVRRTPRAGWYAEELFARFAVLDSRGTVRGTDPCGLPRTAAPFDPRPAAGRRPTRGTSDEAPGSVPMTPARPGYRPRGQVDNGDARPQ